MSCDPVRVTGYVDGALSPAERAEVEEHLAGCDACRAQAEEERALRARLLSLAQPAFPAALESSVRERLRRPEAAPRGRPLRWLLPVAAVLALLVFWAHGMPGIVAREAAWDHGHCFGKRELPAKVWTSSPERITAWFADHGTQLPPIPESAAGLTLVGGRFCRVLDHRFAHLYYAEGDRHLSLHVVPGDVRIGHLVRRKTLDRNVALLRANGSVVALTSEDASAVDAFVRALSTEYVAVEPEPPAWSAPALLLPVDPFPAR